MNSSDIAKIVGVSRSTVSRVINDYPNVPDETKKKVMEVIKKYDYVPHASARLLAGVQNRIIGLFVVDSKTDTCGRQVSASDYFTPFIGDIIDVANNSGYNVLVTRVNKLKDYRRVKEIFYNKTIAGGIFIGQKNDEAEIQEIITAGYKVALVDQSIRTEDDVYSKCIIVNADSLNGAYDATKYLIEMGHAKIAHISGEVGSLSTIYRVEGYKKALKDSGIDFKNSLMVKGNFTEESGYKAVKKLFSKDNPTAVFVANDTMAIGVLQGLKEMGIRVPEDVSVIGFDDIEVAGYMNPALTTMKLPLLEMSEIATKNLIRSIENDTRYSINFTVPVRLMERETCMKINS